MFDIGFPELVVVAIVGLLVIGPERLPEALRTLGLWLGRMRRSFMTVKSEIEKEIGMDEVRRQLHNEAVMEEMKRIEKEVRNTASDVRNTLNDAAADSPKAPAVSASTSRLPEPDAGADTSASAGPSAPAGSPASANPTGSTDPSAATDAHGAAGTTPADAGGPARANNG